ncbi:MAG: hypothetical protein QHJ73_04300 [Armatimonadota bacterium]|nr:hypothetical protein [Armatimonadota bacterium]
MLVLLVLGAVAVLGVAALLWLLRWSERWRQPSTPVGEGLDPEQTALDEVEWRLVVRGLCRPRRCPNLARLLRGTGREAGCEVCAALFLERYGERILKPRRQGRHG